MYNMKFTIFIVLKCTVWWHSLHLKCSVIRFLKYTFFFVSKTKYIKYIEKNYKIICQSQPPEIITTNILASSKLCSTLKDCQKSLVILEIHLNGFLLCSRGLTIQSKEQTDTSFQFSLLLPQLEIYRPE